MRLRSKVRDALHPTCAAVDCGQEIGSREPDLTIDLSRDAVLGLGRRSVTMHGDCVNRHGLLVDGGAAWELDQAAIGRAIGTG